MLATILKSKTATEAAFAIIETFASVRKLQRELMPDLQTSETESSLELNFIIGKLKHTVKRVRKKH